MCGLVGLKPTRGRVITSAPDAPIGMMVESVVTRTVRDTAALVSWLSHRSPWWPAPGWDAPLVAQPDPSARWRIGVWTEAFNGAPVDEHCAAAAVRAGSILGDLGHHVEVAAPSVYAAEETWALAKTALAVSAAAEAAAWTERIGHPLGEADLEPRTWAMVQAGQAVTAPELYEVLERMQVLARAAFEWFERYDLLITPTVPAPASEHGDYLRNYVSGLGSAFTRPINVTGQPAISVPLGWPDDGLPRGVQIVADLGRDGLLVQAAAALEAAEPWAHRTPVVA
jgi:amidase